HPSGDERGAPAVRRGEPGDDRRRERPPHCRPSVEDSHAERALANREPLAHNLGGTGPIARFAETERGPEHAERERRPRGGVCNGGTRPHHDRENEAETRADDVEEPAGHHLADAVEEQKTVLNRGVVGVAQPEVVADRGLQHRDRLAIDVVDDGGQEDQADDQPAKTVDLHRMSPPPLISMVSPVRNELSGEARKATTLATSSGVPARPRRTPFAAFSNAAGGVNRPWNAVSPMRPGATQLARIP